MSTELNFKNCVLLLLCLLAVGMPIIGNSESKISTIPRQEAEGALIITKVALDLMESDGVLPTAHDPLADSTREEFSEEGLTCDSERDCYDDFISLVSESLSYLETSGMEFNSCLAFSQSLQEISSRFETYVFDDKRREQFSRYTAKPFGFLAAYRLINLHYILQEITYLLASRKDRPNLVVDQANTHSCKRRNRNQGVSRLRMALSSFTQFLQLRYVDLEGNSVLQNLGMDQFWEENSQIFIKHELKEVIFEIAAPTLAIGAGLGIQTAWISGVKLSAGLSAILSGSWAWSWWGNRAEESDSIGEGILNDLRSMDREVSFFENPPVDLEDRIKISSLYEEVQPLLEQWLAGRTKEEAKANLEGKLQMFTNCLKSSAKDSRVVSVLGA